MTTLTKIKQSDTFRNLLPSEYAKDTNCQNEMLIDISDMREIVDECNIDVALYVRLSEYNTDDSWNELRIHDLVVDHDAPDDLTAKEWADYLNKYINKQL